MIKIICDRCGKENSCDSITPSPLYTCCTIDPNTNETKETVMITIVREDKRMQMINLCEECTKDAITGHWPHWAKGLPYAKELIIFDPNEPTDEKILAQGLMPAT